MHMRFGLVAVSLLLITACHGQEPAEVLPLPHQTISPPSFSAGVIVKAYDRRTWGANAILIDRERGILVTNAHVARKAEDFDVFLGGRWYRARSDARYIGLDADVALLFIVQGPRDTLPLPAALGVESFVGQISVLAGWQPTFDSGVSFVGYAVQSVSYKTHSGWAEPPVSLGTRVNVLELEVQRLKGGFILPQDRLKLFEGFTMIVQRIRTPTSQFKGGMSGSAMVDEDGLVQGIISATDGNMAFMIPAYEIAELLGQVK